MAPTMPPAPDGLASYVIDALQRQNKTKLLLIQDYVEDLIEYRIAVENQDIDEDEFEDNDNVVDYEELDDEPGYKVTKKQQCGKDCKGCPHGPYTYHVTQNGDGTEKWTIVNKKD
jgi:hypothetical protein